MLLHCVFWIPIICEKEFTPIKTSNQEEISDGVGDKLFIKIKLEENGNISLSSKYCAVSNKSFQLVLQKKSNSEMVYLLMFVM